MSVAETDKPDMITTRSSTKRKVSFLSDNIYFVCLDFFRQNCSLLSLLMLKSVFVASGMRSIYIQYMEIPPVSAFRK